MNNLYGEPIGTHQLYFGWYHSRPSTPLSIDWRFAAPTQNPNRKLRENERTQRKSLYGRPVGFWGNRECGHSHGRPGIFWVPLLSQE